MAAHQIMNEEFKQAPQSNPSPPQAPSTASMLFGNEGQQQTNDNQIIAGFDRPSPYDTFGQQDPGEPELESMGTA